jgi:hypothetical protein
VDDYDLEKLQAVADQASEQLEQLGIDNGQRRAAPKLQGQSLQQKRGLA